MNVHRAGSWSTEEKPTEPARTLETDQMRGGRGLVPDGNSRGARSGTLSQVAQGRGRLGLERKHAAGVEGPQALDQVTVGAVQLDVHFMDSRDVAGDGEVDAVRLTDAAVARFGRIARSRLGPINFGVVGPKRAT